MIMAWGSSKPRKYRRGDPIFTLQDLVNWLEGENYVWWQHKAYHPAIVENWSLAMLRKQIRGGLFRAALTDEYMEWKKRHGK
jgi:hypothetical protein